MPRETSVTRDGLGTCGAAHAALGRAEPHTGAVWRLHLGDGTAEMAGPIEGLALGAGVST